MSSEKKRALVQLMVSAAVSVALYLGPLLVEMSHYAIVYFVICIISFAYTIDKVGIVVFLFWKEPQILRDPTRPDQSISPSRIAAIVGRQNRQ